MARTEARIFTSIWRDEDFLALPPGAQRLYMFLLSQDDLSYCGVMPLRERRWASKAAGLTLADVGQDLKALEAAGRIFIVTDEDTGELLIRSMIRRDSAWKQPNLLKQARESADQIESPKIRAVLAAELRRLPVDDSPSEQVRTLVAEFMSDLDQGKPYPSAYPPGNPSDNPSENPSADPSAKDHARARELGERNGSSKRVLQPPGSDSPMSPQARKLGTRLPEPFTVSQAMKDWFRSNCPHVNARVEHERFLDHWRGKAGKDGRKVDWVATWRNWMRLAEERQRPRGQSSDRRQQATDDQFNRAMLRAEEREGTHDAEGSRHPGEVRQGMLPAPGDR